MLVGYLRILASHDTSRRYRGILHDENLYPSPSTFDPSRFMKDGKRSDTLRDPRDALFGFGRRFVHPVNSLRFSRRLIVIVILAQAMSWEGVRRRAYVLDYCQPPQAFQCRSTSQ